jgi:Fe-S-cluster-containing dehydrogenase component
MSDAPLEFFVDPARCIGCEACVQACAECDTHRGTSLIHLEHVAPGRTTQTTPMVCMHCDSPTCAEVCPADAIKKTPDGVVQSASHPRCIACRNCVLACPFGVPKMKVELELMMKCDMCYDRTSAGGKPMCASVCPSQALAYVTREEIERLRPGSRVVDAFRFGRQEVRTQVKMLVSRRADLDVLDVTGALPAASRGNRIEDGLWDDAEAAIEAAALAAEARP